MSHFCGKSVPTYLSCQVEAHQLPGSQMGQESHKKSDFKLTRWALFTLFCRPALVCWCAHICRWPSRNMLASFSSCLFTVERKTWRWLQLTLMFWKIVKGGAMEGPPWFPTMGDGGSLGLELSFPVPQHTPYTKNWPKFDRWFGVAICNHMIYPNQCLCWMKLGPDSRIQIVSIFRELISYSQDSFSFLSTPNPEFQYETGWLPGQILSNPIDSHRKANI